MGHNTSVLLHLHLRINWILIHPSAQARGSKISISPHPHAYTSKNECIGLGFWMSVAPHLLACSDVYLLLLNLHLRVTEQCLFCRVARVPSGQQLRSKGLWHWVTCRSSSGHSRAHPSSRLWDLLPRIEHTPTLSVQTDFYPKLTYGLSFPPHSYSRDLPDWTLPGSQEVSDACG